MQIIRTISEMKQQADAWRSKGKRIGFVPTMGFLHEGHLSLVQISKKKTDRTVVSLFVNPTQFGPQEDFSAYPRDEKGDLEKIKKEGVDAAFLPTAEEMYPNGFQTSVRLSEITQGLCGAGRPGHFDGVATVVLKLFHIVKPDVAVFGEKDFQQLAVIRRMVKDLNLDLKIVGAPTARSPEGLALSSRNSYLSAEEKKEALVLSQALKKVRELHRKGAKNASTLLAEAKKIIVSAPSAVIDYLSIVDSATLEPLEKIDRPARFLLAVTIGKTRLIDNGPVQL